MALSEESMALSASSADRCCPPPQSPTQCVDLGRRLAAARLTAARTCGTDHRLAHPLAFDCVLQRSVVSTKSTVCLGCGRSKRSGEIACFDCILDLGLPFLPFPDANTAPPHTSRPPFTRKKYPKKPYRVFIKCDGDQYYRYAVVPAIQCCARFTSSGVPSVDPEDVSLTWA